MTTKRSIKNKKCKATKVRDRLSRENLTEIKRLGMEYENLTLAEAKGVIAGRSIVTLVASNVKAAEAWRRGQFLRACLMLAENTPLYDAAKYLTQHHLGPFESGKELKDTIDRDSELNNIWYQRRLAARIATRSGMQSAVNSGHANPSTVAAVERFLRDADEEGDGKSKDWYMVSLKQLETLVGTTRQTLWRWRDEPGMPVIGQGQTARVDLRKFIPWYADQIAKRSRGEKQSALNPLQHQKAQVMAIELKEQMGELVSDTAWIAWSTAVLQAIIGTFSDLTQMANDMAHKGPEELSEALQRLQDDLAGHLHQIPDELKLSDGSKAKLMEFYGSLQADRDVARPTISENDGKNT